MEHWLGSQKMTMMTRQRLGKNLDVFCNFVPKKPENKPEGIPPNYQLPIGMPSLV
jgi:hypothetical protein